MTDFIDGLALALPIAVNDVKASQAWVHEALENARVCHLQFGNRLDELSKQAGSAKGYLDIVLDPCLKATRQGYESTADFSRYTAPWQLFVCLWESGEAGRRISDLKNDLGMENTSETALRQRKDKVNNVIADLGLEIEASGTGVWKLRPL